MFVHKNLFSIPYNVSIKTKQKKNPVGKYDAAYYVESNWPDGCLAEMAILLWNLIKSDISQ